RSERSRPTADRRETQSARGPDKAANTPGNKSSEVADTSDKPPTKDGQAEGQPSDPSQGVTDGSVAASENEAALLEVLAAEETTALVQGPENAKPAVTSDLTTPVAIPKQGPDRE